MKQCEDCLYQSTCQLWSPVWDNEMDAIQNVYGDGNLVRKN